MIEPVVKMIEPVVRRSWRMSSSTVTLAPYGYGDVGAGAGDGRAAKRAGTGIRS